MSDKIRRVTPREIAEMMMGEQAYQSTLFVTAADHDAEIERLRKRVAELEYAYSKCLAAIGGVQQDGDLP
jgi:hypothetical protein